MIIDSNENKEKILINFLEISINSGWNLDSLKKSITACDIEEKYLPIIFPNGIDSLIEFYIEFQNKFFEKNLIIDDEFNALKVRDKIKKALFNRFLIEQKNQKSLKKLKKDVFEINNIAKNFKKNTKFISYFYQISDVIWKKINDSSTDFNFYTKRLTLSKIIFKTFLAFLRDETENLEKVKLKIDQEIDEVMKFEKNKQRVKKFISNIANKEFKDFGCDRDLKNNVINIVSKIPFLRLIPSAKKNF
jgi:ubiquinone biosynthesis protein COQ9